MSRDEIPAALRRDVRLLSTILGEVIVESNGQELLDDIERLRRATIGLRARPGAARTRAVTEIVSSLDPERSELVARAAQSALTCMHSSSAADFTRRSDSISISPSAGRWPSRSLSRGPR